MPNHDDPNDPLPPRDDVTALVADPRFVLALKRLQRQLERLAARLDAIRDVIDAAGGGLENLIDRLPGAITVAPRAHRALPSNADACFMRAEGEAGVTAIDLQEHADGSCDVRINGRRAFRVAPQPAALLAILVGTRQPDLDGFVRWRTKSEVATALGKLTGRPVTPAGVTGILHKLRGAFRDAGENVWLLHVRRERGIRFALRPVIDGDPR